MLPEFSASFGPNGASGAEVSAELGDGSDSARETRQDADELLAKSFAKNGEGNMQNQRGEGDGEGNHIHAGVDMTKALSERSLLVFKKINRTTARVAIIGLTVGITIVSVFSVAAELFRCHQVSHEGPEEAPASLFARDLSQTFQEHPEALVFLHSKTGCSCNDVTDIRLQKNSDGDLFLGNSSRELQVNESRTEFCGPPESMCFVLDGRFDGTFSNERFWIVGGNSKIEGFAQYQKVFFEPVAEATVAESPKLIEELRETHELRPWIMRTQLATDEPDHETRFTFLETGKAIQALLNQQAELQARYNAANEDLFNEFKAMSISCDINEPYLYIAVVFFIVAAWQAVLILRQFWKALGSDGPFLLDEKLLVKFLTIDLITCVFALGYLSAIFQHTLDELLTVIVISINLLGDLVYLLILWIEEEPPLLDNATHSKETTWRSKSAQLRYLSIGLGLGMTVFSVLVTIGVTVDCRARQTEGPEQVLVENFFVDLQTLILTQPERILYTRPPQGCSCDFDISMEKTEDGAWFLANPEILVNESMFEWCGEVDSGCFELDPVFFTVNSISDAIINSDAILDRFNVFLAEVIDPVNSLTFLSSEPFLRNLLEETDSAKPWIIRGEPGEVPFHRFFFFRYNTSVQLVLEEQLDARARFEKREEEFEDEFFRETIPCNSDLPFFGLQISILVLSGLQLLIFMLVMVEVMKVPSTRLAVMENPRYLRLLLFDTFINILGIAFCSSATSIELTVSLGLTLVALSINSICNLCVVAWLCHQNLKAA